MKQYIGTKIVEAEPATLYELKEGGHFLKKASEEWTPETSNILSLSSSLPVTAKRWSLKARQHSRFHSVVLLS